MFRMPGPTDRTMVIGSTGEGKTQFSTWLLGEAPFTQMPYIVIDYKRDDLLAQLQHIKEIGPSEKLPSQPGLYIVHPDPNTDQEHVEEMLYNVWSRGNTGLYFDEGYMVPKSGAHERGYFNSILTQGRSKRIPAIVLTQRPAHISRFVFSEAQHKAAFFLNDADDRKTTRRFFPEKINFSRPLPKYHSWWYSSGERDAVIMRPVPPADDLLERIDSRLQPMKSGKRFL